MLRHDPARRLAALLAAIMLAAAALPVMVMADADLVTQSPAARSTATEPVTVVTGIFSEAMTVDGSSLVVKDAAGAKVAVGAVDPTDDKRMTATPATPLGSGAYEVEWTAVATDGHVQRGRWTFKVVVAPTPSPTPVPTAVQTAVPTPTAASVATLPASPASSVGPTPAPPEPGDASTSGTDVVLPIVAALIVLAGGAAYLLTRRTRPPEGT